MRPTFYLLAICFIAGCQTPNAKPTETTVVKSAFTSLPPLAPIPQQVDKENRPPTIEQVAHQEQVLAPPASSQPLPASSPPLEKISLDLADLEQMALSANPSIARASAMTRAAQGTWTQVGLAPNPSVGYEGQQIGSRGLAEQDGVFISQEIVRGGKLKLNREVAAQEWSRAEQELAAQRQRVLSDVRIAFYTVLVAQRQETLTKQILTNAQEGLKAANSMFKASEVGRVDVVQAQLELENTEILLQNARNRRVASWKSLTAVVGNPLLPMQELNGDPAVGVPELDWDESMHQLLTVSPEISAAMANVQRTRWAVQRAMVEKTPNVTVQGLVNWRDNGIGGGSDGAISVGVPLPLWNKNQGGVVQAQGEAVAAERALQQLELSMQQRLAPVYERYTNALQQSKRYQERILPGAADSLELARSIYKAGENNYVTLLTAQRTYTQTNMNYLESLRELRTAEAEIQGMLLTGSLNTR